MVVPAAEARTQTTERNITKRGEMTNGGTHCGKDFFSSSMSAVLVDTVAEVQHVSATRAREE